MSTNKQEPNRRKSGHDQRKVERREPKRGVNVRHGDTEYIPKRVKQGRIEHHEGSPESS